MSNDETGPEKRMKDYIQMSKWAKVNGSCFCLLFASDAEAGTWTADDNGFL